MQAFCGGRGCRKKNSCGGWGRGQRDKRINERKLMTNDRLSWIQQSLKSQISNLYFFICGGFYSYIIPFFAPFLNSFQRCQ